jgi:hypothetical protein
VGRLFRALHKGAVALIEPQKPTPEVFDDLRSVKIMKAMSDSHFNDDYTSVTFLKAD